MRAFTGICFSTSLVLLTGVTAFAQSAPSQPAAEPAAEQKKDEKLPTGVIASYGSSQRSSSVDVSSTDSAPGDKGTPVVGRIKQLGNNQCEVTVQNLSKKDSYSVNYAVIGTDSSGREVFKRTFSSTLGKERSTTNRVTCEQGLSMSVVLRSGKRLGK
jgi:hypothetical protein